VAGSKTSALPDLPKGAVSAALPDSHQRGMEILYERRELRKPVRPRGSGAA